VTGLFEGYLFAYVFWVSLSLGCLGLLLLHHVFRAKWGRAILPVLEAGAGALWPMAVLMVPILLWGMPELYEWSRGAHGDPIYEHRAVYLNIPFFVGRTIAYYAVWLGLASFLIRSSRRERQTGDDRSAQSRANISAPGLVAFVLTVTFAMTDWVMSVEHQWFSTIYGVWFITGQGLSAVALGALWRRRAPQLPNAGAGEDQHGGADYPVSRDLGNLLLAFTLTWAYISLSQFLIIWSANLPEETTFYLRRTGGGWQNLAVALIVGQFAVPFLALLSGKTKRSPRLLASVAALALAMRVIDVYWIVAPSVREGSAIPTAFDIGALVGIGVVWIAAFAVGLRSAQTTSRIARLPEEAISHA